ncbi:UDP-glucosyltransferase [Holotrichia oblita]|uniref:UDP-glucosyltransferase n=1 Tax=Holotrichia oblita TaxID=644536 RepID=A0ACB9T5K8_HOLOL|nr:UDP-glucosyltransferase [Holotrichia oblita]
MSTSHYTIGHSLAKGLAARGHQVTFAAPFEKKESIKNLKSVYLEDVKKQAEERFSKSSIFDIANVSAIVIIPFMSKMGLWFSEITYADKAIQTILNSNETYDAVITEAFATDALQGIAYHFNAPSILVTTIGPSTWTNYLTASPSVYSYISNPFLSFTQKMTFYQRIINILAAFLQTSFNSIYSFPQHEKILHKYVPDAPNLYDLIKNTSLHLFNSDPVLHVPLPLAPNIVEIGGIHIEPPKKLPDDLQNFLDDSKEGVIYFSMGGNVKSKEFPQATRDAILRVFSKLKEKVLWKFEDDLPGKPKNVEIRKWLPQQDILAHPNVKLFITHGGLLGGIESLLHGVPVVGIPIFGDQALNMKNAVNRGYGISIPYKEFTEEKFSSALQGMLGNPSYSQKAKEMSILLNDKQVKQIDKAAYWIEYVIRHKGAPHLRVAAHELTWYQYYSLDVILFLILIKIILIKVFWIVVKKLCNRLCSRKQNKQKQN